MCLTKIIYYQTCGGVTNIVFATLGCSERQWNLLRQLKEIDGESLKTSKGQETINVCESEHADIGNVER